MIRSGAINYHPKCRSVNITTSDFVEKSRVFDDFCCRIQMDQMADVPCRSSHDDLHRQGLGRHESRHRSCHAPGWHAAGESEAGSRCCLRVLRRCRGHETRFRGITDREKQKIRLASLLRTLTTSRNSEQNFPPNYVKWGSNYAPLSIEGHQSHVNYFHLVIFYALVILINL